MVSAGDIYLIPLLPGRHVVATVLNLGAAPWNPRIEIMLIGIRNRLIDGTLPVELPGLLAQQYWCDCSFVEEGKWSLVRHENPATSERPMSAACVWATHEVFLDDVRQRLGLPRQTYTSSEFTFSTHCRECGAELHKGFARCRNCRAIRAEFRGLERFVADSVGCCCLSGSETDVRDSDGNYYWAPYFIDRVRACSTGSALLISPG